MPLFNQRESTIQLSSVYLAQKLSDQSKKDFLMQKTELSLDIRELKIAISCQNIYTYKVQYFQEEIGWCSEFSLTSFLLLLIIKCKNKTGACSQPSQLAPKAACSSPKFARISRISFLQLYALYANE